MSERTAAARGFSIIEVVIAMSVVVFSLVAILGVFPRGLSMTHESMTDTRAAHLANTIFATLRIPPFTSVECYGAGTGTPPRLDLSAVNPLVTLYAEYPVAGSATITPTASPNSIYTIQLRFNNAPAGLPTAGLANQVTVNVSPNGDQGRAVRFVSIISK